MTVSFDINLEIELIQCAFSGLNQETLPYAQQRIS